MKRTLLAVLLVALAAVLVPSFAAADPGSAVQADLTQLSTDLKSAHDALVADLGAVTTAAQAGDNAGAIAAIDEGPLGCPDAPTSRPEGSRSAPR